MNREELFLGATVGLEDAGHSSGTATAPTAATDLLTSPQTVKAGKYEFDVTVSMTGTAETLTRNLNLRMGSTVIVGAIPSVPGTTKFKFRRTVTNTDITTAGSGVLQLRPVANATGGAVYTVAVQSTLIGG